MSLSIRNTGIYVLAAILAVILVSRVVTVAFLITYAPEDAEAYFYLKQILISAVCIGAIIWLWSKRIRQQAREKGGR
jgi:phosphate starvation-inducible membrane PsiE